ncbi:hypothetical protein Taro_025037 [Colocasia esculenta]|uniref:Uncharacterized protein n=1 Tax=Colocasia esculenta TaxID=4460 RepID=A0A843VM57_COLES|nr:hypothetical protein [Colocasia esculenta]
MWYMETPSLVTCKLPVFEATGRLSTGLQAAVDRYLVFQKPEVSVCVILSAGVWLLSTELVFQSLLSADCVYLSTGSLVLSTGETEDEPYTQEDGNDLE